MHFMPDTEDEDSAAETFWPEGYKQFIREIAPSFYKIALTQDKPFLPVYERDYKDRYPDYNDLIAKLADVVAVSVDNGADNAFDDIVNSFLREAPLPQIRAYARYLPAAVLNADIKDKLGKVIIDEYKLDNIYVYAYGVGYKKTFPTFDDYIQQIAALVINGAQNSANDTLEIIYRSLYFRAPLPPSRRHPRRLKVW